MQTFEEYFETKTSVAFLKGETDKVYELCPKCATYYANADPPE